MNDAALYSNLDQIKSQVIAMADLLDRPPGSGPVDRETPRGLSRLAWHIVTDIEGIQREFEALLDNWEDKAKSATRFTPTNIAKRSSHDF
jgi:hypothetical protein